MGKRLLTISTVLLLISTMAIIGCSSDSQESVAPADFYRGKTINLIVSHSAGSSSDRVSRVLASYLERDTGANVVVTNRVGAGGLDGINYVYRSEPNGLTLGAVTQGKLVPNIIMNEPAAQYNIEDFSYIMNIGTSLYYLMVSADGPYQCVADLQAGKELIIGGGSLSGPIALGGMTVIELLDLDAVLVTGINSVADQALAVKRGEIAGYACIMPSSISYVDSGMVEPMFVLATAKDPLMPNVPAITELVNIQEDDLVLVELWETVLASTVVWNAPPGTPEDRLAFLRGMAAEWPQDEEFREEINSAFGYEVQTYVIGETVAETMSDIASTLDDFRDIFADMIAKHRS
jgi:tripartite-type tricarboxylate transporter receptor subunit TctC